MLKCPTCASGLRFDIASQMLHCDACSNSYAPDLFDTVSTDAELQADLKESQPGKRGLYETAVWTCPGCGAVLTYADDTDVTSVCAYCGSSNIMFERIRGERRPDSIVPFAVTKKDCMIRYKKRARRAFLSPGYLHSKGQIESFRGIYMPYFDYYASMDGNLKLKIETYNADASDKYNNVYDVKELKGHVTGKVFGKTHDASVRFSDDISENLGDYGQRKPFSPGYLCGFYAETDDAGLGTHAPSEEELDVKINEAILFELSCSNAPEIPEELKNSTVNAATIKVEPKKRRAERTLYPVWFMSHRMKNNKLTYAAVNGSTGKIVADFPMSFIRVLLFALGTAFLYFLFLNFVGLMPRPVPALGTTMMLFMVGTVCNSFVQEKKLSRLNPAYDISLLKTLRIFLGVSLGITFLVAVAGEDNSTWRGAAAFLYFLPFLTERIGALLVTRGLIKKVDAEEMRVTYRDLRFALAIPTINFCVPLSFSFISLIILLTNSRNEVYYYTAAANAVCFLGLFILTVRVNNYFSYRRPPQFNKKGGDDRAK